MAQVYNIDMIYQIWYIIVMYEIKILDPAIEFIDSVPLKMQVKIFRTIDLLEKFGPYLTEPHSKKLSGYDLYELRVKLASDIVRLFYFNDAGKFYVITSGFSKKKNKTSKKKLNRATRIMRQYMEEKNESN